MSGEIRINDAAVEEEADAISGAAAYFMEDLLIPSDSKTTITANAKGQEAFAKAQKLIASFGSSMEQEVDNIRSLGAVFQEYDDMMGELLENGYRTPVITTME